MLGLSAGHQHSQQPLIARQGTAWWGGGISTPGDMPPTWQRGLQHPHCQPPPYFADEITTECLSDSRILARWKATESA